MVRPARTGPALSDDRRIFLLAAAVRDAASCNVTEAVTWSRSVRDRIHPRGAPPTVRDRWQTMKNALNNPKPGGWGGRGPDLERVLAAWERGGIGVAPVPEQPDDPRRALTERLVVLRLAEVSSALHGSVPTTGVRAAQDLLEGMPPASPSLDPAVATARAELADMLRPVNNFSDPRELAPRVDRALARMRAAYYTELVYDEAPPAIRQTLFPDGRPSLAQLLPAPLRLQDDVAVPLEVPEDALLPGDERVPEHVVALLRHGAADGWQGVVDEATQLAVHMVTDGSVVPEGGLRDAWMRLREAATELARRPGDPTDAFQAAAEAVEDAVDDERGVGPRRLARLDPELLARLWAALFAVRAALREPPASRGVLVGGALQLGRCEIESLDTITRLELDARLGRVDAELRDGDREAAARAIDVAVFRCERAAELRRAPAGA